MSELTNKELQSYINEINRDFSVENSSAENIALELLKEQNILNDTELPEPDSIELESEDPEQYSGDLEIYTETPKISGPIELRYEKRKQIERETIDEALHQTYLDLNTLISLSDKKTLIAFLVDDLAIAKSRYQNFIRQIFNKSFRKYIPTNVMSVWLKYPYMFVPFPGFNYECSKEYGEGQKYWVDLNLPMYFRPEVCESLFKSRCIDRVPRVEKAIVRYYATQRLKIKNEVKYARELACISTYYQLLKQKPYWYHILITYLKKKNGWDKVQA